MIQGVEIINLDTKEDERGFFREVYRFDELFKGVRVGQLSHSMVNEGVVKAWHGHVYQYQWNYVLAGKAQVVLYDDRESSPTYKQLYEFTAEEHSPVGYFFPPGVLHGYRCLNGPMHIIYVTSDVYDLQDEVRRIKSYVKLNLFANS